MDLSRLGRDERRVAGRRGPRRPRRPAAARRRRGRARHLVDQVAEERRLGRGPRRRGSPTPTGAGSPPASRAGGAGKANGRRRPGRRRPTARPSPRPSARTARSKPAGRRPTTWSQWSIAVEERVEVGRRPGRTGLGDDHERGRRPVQASRRRPPRDRLRPADRRRRTPPCRPRDRTRSAIDRRPASALSDRRRRSRPRGRPPRAGGRGGSGRRTGRGTSRRASGSAIRPPVAGLVMSRVHDASQRSTRPAVGGLEPTRDRARDARPTTAVPSIRTTDRTSIVVPSSITSSAAFNSSSVTRDSTKRHADLPGQIADQVPGRAGQDPRPFGRPLDPARRGPRGPTNAWPRSRGRRRRRAPPRNTPPGAPPRWRGRSRAGSST